MCSLQKKKTLARSPQKRSRSALTYHELLSNFIFPLDMDNSVRICSACRMTLTSSKYKQSVERLLMEVNTFKFFFVLKWERNTHIKRLPLQISESGFEVRKSRCSVQQWINICSTIFSALLSYKIKRRRLFSRWDVGGCHSVCLEK